MESDFVPEVPESASKLQDRMGDAHSKDLEHSNSSQREIPQEYYKPSSPTLMEYSSASSTRAIGTDFIKARGNYPASLSESFVEVDIAEEASEGDGEISKEKESVLCVKHVSTPPLSKETNMIQPATSDDSESSETTQHSNFVQNESDAIIQSGLSVKSESTEEIQPTSSQEPESTEGIQPPLSQESEFIEVTQRSLSKESDSTEGIQPALSRETESTEVIQPAISEETESTEVIQPAISEETESTEVIQPAISEETESTEVIQPAISEETESTEVIQPAISEESESTEVIHPAISEETESIEVIYPAVSKETESNEKIQSTFSVEMDSTEEINPDLSAETVSPPVIQLPSFEETEVIQTPAPEDNESTTVMKPVISENTESSESVHPDPSEETKLTELKETVISEEINLSKVTELNTLESSGSKKVISSPVTKNSQITSNNMNASVEPAILSKGFSETNLDLSNSKESSDSFSPAFDPEGFFSLLNTGEYKNGSHLVFVNDHGGGQVIVTPSKPPPGPIFPNFAMPPLSQSTEIPQMNSNENLSPVAESVHPAPSEETKLTELKETVISEEVNLSKVIELNTLESSCGKKVISSPQSKNSQITSNNMNASVEPEILSKGFPETNLDLSNSKESSGSLSPALDTQSFLSLLNTEEYKNGKHLVFVNDYGGGQVIVEPSKPLPEPIFPNFEMPSLSPPTEMPQIESNESLSPVATSNRSNTLDFSNSEENLNYFSPALDMERFLSRFSTEEYKNVSQFVSMGDQGVDQVRVTPTTPLPGQGFPDFVMPPLSPPTLNPELKSFEISYPELKSFEISRPTHNALLNTEESKNGILTMDQAAHSGDQIAATSSSTGGLFSSNFEKLPSPPAKNPSMKLIGKVSPTKDSTLLTDVTSHRTLPAYFSVLSNWIDRSWKKSSIYFEKPIDVDFINYYKRELEYGVDLEKQIADRIETLVSAAEGLPDPTCVFPNELGSGGISVRDSLIKAGLMLKRKLNAIQAKTTIGHKRFVSLCLNDSELNSDGFGSKEVATEAPHFIFQLFAKISQDFLKLGVDIEMFRDHIRDFCLKTEMLLRGI